MSTSGTLACDMDGYTTMVDQIMNLALLAITLNMSLIESALDLMTLTDLSVTVEYGYKFLKSGTSWIGYAVAAVYYLAED